jgi:hypothetical protein
MQWLEFPLWSKGPGLEPFSEFFREQKLNGCKIEPLKSSIKVLSQCFKKNLGIISVK